MTHKFSKLQNMARRHIDPVNYSHYLHLDDIQDQNELLRAHMIMAAKVNVALFADDAAVATLKKKENSFGIMIECYEIDCGDGHTLFVGKKYHLQKGYFKQTIDQIYDSVSKLSADDLEQRPVLKQIFDALNEVGAYYMSYHRAEMGKKIADHPAFMALYNDAYNNLLENLMKYETTRAAGLKQSQTGQNRKPTDLTP